ncbi:hypothetical protein G4G27_06420 [Sphingomonas sp. So64.6b]|uniref:hypothetical protein n=1 Tax=Sphingomonas sp. So64.6b TaxID=2997354 RepID=UPI001602C21D|nr:hypothetical protein [Sphingomonas sp. So64.6b]QNA83673.1 hypothetical protein G4G27_06420 [Sphingomonas sp. So64.6b]
MYRSTYSGSGSVSGSGPVAATLLAGPIFVIGLLLGTWSTTMDAAIIVPDLPDVGAGVFITIVVGIVLTMLVGALVSGIPNLLGTRLMQWFGRHNAAMRLPVAWALAGGLSTALPVAMIGGTRNDMIAGFAFSFTGAICALICRWRVVWDDPAPQPLSGAPRVAIGK